MPAAALAAAPGATAAAVYDLAALIHQAAAAAGQGVDEGDLPRSPAMKMTDSSDPGFLYDGETRLTRLACPECGGVLAEVSLPAISYFHCHVGHQYGPQALAAAQAEVAEKKIWSAVAALDEQAVVLHYLAQHGSPAEGVSSAAGQEGSPDYARLAQEAGDLAETIRMHLRQHRG
jgi:two-component system chemotaxis response regulator CheB